jgi:hypothetical protein
LAQHLLHLIENKVVDPGRQRALAYLVLLPQQVLAEQENGLCGQLIQAVTKIGRCHAGVATELIYLMGANLDPPPFIPFGSQP